MTGGCEASVVRLVQLGLGSILLYSVVSCCIAIRCLYGGRVSSFSMLTIVDAESVVSIEVFDESAVEENVGIDGVVGLVCDVACKLRNAGSEVGMCAAGTICKDEATIQCVC